MIHPLVAGFNAYIVLGLEGGGVGRKLVGGFIISSR